MSSGISFSGGVKSDSGTPFFKRRPDMIEKWTKNPTKSARKAAATFLLSYFNVGRPNLDEATSGSYKSPVLSHKALDILIPVEKEK